MWEVLGRCTLDVDLSSPLASLLLVEPAMMLIAGVVPDALPGLAVEIEDLAILARLAGLPGRRQ